MLIVSDENIKKLELKSYQLLEWAEKALLNKKHIELPSKISIEYSKGGFYNFMPVILPFEQCAGIKIVTRYLKQSPSINSDILLYNLKDGTKLALFESNLITLMRTAAVAVHSTSLFSRHEVKEIAFIGLGKQNYMIAKLLFETIYLCKSIIVNIHKYKDYHYEFAMYVKSINPNVILKYCDSYSDTIKSSDVIYSAPTFLEKDICNPSDFKDGALLLPVHTRGFLNCDFEFKIFVDDINHVRKFKNFDKVNMRRETVDVLLNNINGRSDNQEKIIVYNVGIGLHDIYFANEIYKLLKKGDYSDTNS